MRRYVYDYVVYIKTSRLVFSIVVNIDELLKADSNVRHLVCYAVFWLL